MRIPKKLKIGAHSYEVRIVHTKNGESIGADSSGYTSCHKNHVIELDGNLAPTELGATFIHEIMHATNAQWTMNDSMHALMEATAQQLFQVLHDNKMLR